MFRLIASLFFSALITIPTLVIATHGGRPLDLPVGVRATSGEDDDDHSEVIEFYGIEYEGSAFFWCLDRSASMQGEKLEVLKDELIHAIGLLSPKAEFGIISYSEGFDLFRPNPVRATKRAKQAARTYVRNLVASGSTSMSTPAKRILQLSQESKLPSKQVICVGDGLPGDQFMTLMTVRFTNTEEIPVHTLLLQQGENSEQGKQFYQSLAESNHGDFRVIH